MKHYAPLMELLYTDRDINYLIEYMRIHNISVLKSEFSFWVIGSTPLFKKVMFNMDPRSRGASRD